MRPFVRLRLPDGSTVDAPPGAIVGRSDAAAVRLGHAGVSEAHALISLRGRVFRMLALRGRVLVDAEPEDDIVLEPGLRVRLAEVALDVEKVVIPTRVVAVAMPDRELRELCAPVYSLAGSDWVPRYVPEAGAWLVADGEAWRLDRRDLPSQALSVGSTWDVHGWRCALIETEASLLDNGTASPDFPPAAIVWTVAPGRVTATHAGASIAEVDGRPGEVLSALLRRQHAGAASRWTDVAGDVWPALVRTDLAALRRSFDRALARLRADLREAGLVRRLEPDDDGPTRGWYRMAIPQADRVVFA